MRGVAGRAEHRDENLHLMGLALLLSVTATVCPA